MKKKLIFVIIIVGIILGGHIYTNSLLVDECKSENPDISKIETLLTLQASPNSSCDEYDNNCLYYALKNNNTELAELLVEKGAEKQDLYYLMIYSIKENNIESLKELIRFGGDVNATSYHHNGKTPLMFALDSNFIDIVNLLIEKEADCNKSTPDGIYPIHYALKRNSNEALGLLLKNGATPNIVDTSSTSLSPLGYAIKNNNIESCNMLLSKGASTESRELEKGLTPIQYALTFEDIDIRIILTLIKNNANLNAYSYELKNVYAYAKEYDNYTYLIKDNGGLEHSLVMDALIKSDIEKLKEAVAKDTLRNFVDNNGYTALTYAIEKLPIEYSEILLSNNANPDHFDENLLPIQYAIKINDINKIELLLKNEANVDYNLKKEGALYEVYTPLIYAIALNNEDAIKLLLAKGAKVDKVVKFGFQAIHFVNSKKNPEKIINILVDNGADINALTKTSSAAELFGETTPLMVAATNGDIKLIKALVKAGSDVNLKNENNRTALNFAEDSNENWDLSYSKNKTADLLRSLGAK